MNSVSPGQFFALKNFFLLFLLLLCPRQNGVLANGETEAEFGVSKKSMLCPPLVCACSDVDLSANCSHRGFLSMPPALPTLIRILDLSYNDLVSMLLTFFIFTTDCVA
jgi:hypothetical protein